jgi:alcohol dehydrogenase class IV
VKSGISHPRLRPALAVVDPLTTLTLPPEVTAACGMDVVCHALEAYTARPFAAYPRRRAEQRVAYCGANPIADAWAERALQLVAGSLRRAVLAGHDLEARTAMMQAATFAGMGFGNAGVHLPHACAYPIAGKVRGYVPAGYGADEPLVPHGQSVAVTAPAAFRFTYPADPARHERAAALLGGRPGRVDGRELLPDTLVRLMRDIGVPNGVAAFGYDDSDVPGLVEGTMQQRRLLVIAPREVAEEDLAAILRDSMRNW